MEIKLPSFLERYRKLRKVTAPPVKPHGKRKYMKADRKRNKEITEDD